MKAILYHEYGSPDVLRCEEIQKPVPREDEVIIRVCAAAINPMECGVIKGAGRFLNGWRRPRITCLGVDVAGQVEAAGKKVTRFKPGDNVFGVCVRNPQDPGLGVWTSHGALAEYACVSETALAIKPENVSFEQAAAVPVAALTALQGLRDKGKLQPGQEVLINGASGGVGTFAVQVAKAFGANVTAVCSARNVELVQSIGADRVIDYTREDFTRSGEKYDILFDCIVNHSALACRRILKPNGIYVAVGGPHGPMLGAITRMLMALFVAFVASRFASRKLVIFIARPNSGDLDLLSDLLKSGKVIPVVNGCFALNETADAMRFLEQGHARGKVVITIACPRSPDPGR